MMTLEEYFRECYNNGDWSDGSAVEHAVRHRINEDGDVQIYIHPANVSGDTLDYIVRGDEIIPIK